MYFTINRSVFVSKLSHIAHCVPSASPSAALMGLRFEVKPDHIVMTASDQKTTMETIISCDERNGLVIDEPGGMVINVGAIIELLRRMKDEIVTVESLDDVQLRLTGETGGKFDINGQKIEDYPVLDLSQPGSHVTLPARILKDISTQVAFSAASENARVVLTGVNIRVADHQLIATATNTLTLARKTAPVLTDASLQINVPVKAITLFAASAEEVEEVDLYFDHQKLQMSAGDTLYQTALLEGNFPDTDRLLSTKTVTDLEVSAEELDGLISRATVYTAEKAVGAGIVPVKFLYDQDSITVEVLLSKIGSCRQNIEDFKFSGESGRVAFNANLMVPMLRAIKGHEKVILSFGGELAPFKINLPDDDSFVMLMVPMRAN